MSSSDELIRRRERVVCQGVGRMSDLTVASAHGATVTDLVGRAFIDFAGGIGVMNVGHCDEQVVRAIREQAGELLHASIHVATYEPYVALCEKLVELLPHGPSTKALLVNTGAEAVENAIKIARQATGRAGVICFTGAFHGRTLLATSLTSKVSYKIGCGPFAPEVYRLPYPLVRQHRGGSEHDVSQRELTRLRAALHDTVAPGNVAAIIIELVQGEGGFNVAPPEYVRGLREICDEHGIMLIFDEVQTGFGRTGRWAAYEHYGVTPDLSTWAKSLGGGLPISAVLGKAEVMDRVTPGTLGGTYGGNPVACAGALATIRQMESLGLNARGEHSGTRIRERFEAIASRVPEVTDVRGLGAMMAIEFSRNGDPATPDAALTKSIVATCRDNGLIVIPAGVDGNVIRVLAPLVISDADLERGLDILDNAISAHTKQPARAGSEG
ncbi:MAG: aspartate aminotransferase family protein [Phycisphaeraceae bacterium]|nr:MAG: aspartate aminotransferase family protein [Phycisphaeraceae bacterium]